METSWGKQVGFHKVTLTKYLIGFLGRELPDLKMSCFQVQLENVNETHFSYGKYINPSSFTEVKNGPQKKQRSGRFSNIFFNKNSHCTEI